MNAARSSRLAVLLLALAVSKGTAQSISSPYRFVESTQSGGLFAGYIAPSGSTVGLGPKSGPVAGLRYTIRLSGPFTVEAEVGYASSTRPVRDTVVVDSARQIVGEADSGLLIANAALRFNLTGPRTWHNLQPYVLFGAGAVMDVLGENGDDETVAADIRFDFGTTFAGQLGGGIEWFATDRLTLRIDARNALWKLKTPAPFLLGDFGEGTPGDEWVNNGFFTIGLSIHF